MPGWRRSVPAWAIAVGQVLGEACVVDAQGGIAVSARRCRRAALVAGRGGFPLPELLLLRPLRLCFSEGRAATCPLASQRSSPCGSPMIKGRGGLFFQSECDHVVM